MKRKKSKNILFRSCGPTGGQSQMQAGEINFYNQLGSEYKSVFGDDVSLYNDIVGLTLPIAEAGPTQEGESPTAIAAQRTQATQSAAAGATQAATAVGNAIASRGGGNEFAPSGAAAEVEGDIASRAEANLSNQQLQITEQDYATGRANWLAAIQGLSGAPGILSEGMSAANPVIGAGSSASSEANAIAQEGMSWMGVLGGLAGTATGFIPAPGGSANNPNG